MSDPSIHRQNLKTLRVNKKPITPLAPNFLSLDAGCTSLPVNWSRAVPPRLCNETDWRRVITYPPARASQIPSLGELSQSIVAQQARTCVDAALLFLHDANFVAVPAQPWNCFWGGSTFCSSARGIGKRGTYVNFWDPRCFWDWRDLLRWILLVGSLFLFLVFVRSFDLLYRHSKKEYFMYVFCLLGQIAYWNIILCRGSLDYWPHLVIHEHVCLDRVENHRAPIRVLISKRNDQRAIKKDMPQ